MEKRLSNSIPDHIQQRILKDKNISEHIFYVYRVAKSGKIESDTFNSTYDDILNGLPQGKYNMDDIATYSTSGNLSKEKCAKFLHLQKTKYSPPACMIGGYTVYGLSKQDDHSTHVNWWIYDGYKERIVKEQHFEIIDEGE